MFTLLIFEILLLQGRSVFSHAQRRTGSENVKFPVKNLKYDSVVEIA